MTVGLSSEVCLLPTSKLSKTQHFLIIYACKHIILGTITTTIFSVCGKFYTNLCFMKSGKNIKVHQNSKNPKFPGVLQNLQFSRKSSTHLSEIPRGRV